MNNVREQRIGDDGGDIRPIIVNVGNFNKPDGEGEEREGAGRGFCNRTS